MMPPTITFTGNAPMKAEGQKDAPKGAGEAAFAKLMLGSADGATLAPDPAIAAAAEISEDTPEEEQVDEPVAADDVALPLLLPVSDPDRLPPAALRDRASPAMGELRVSDVASNGPAAGARPALPEAMPAEIASIDEPAREKDLLSGSGDDPGAVAKPERANQVAGAVFDGSGRSRIESAIIIAPQPIEVTDPGPLEEPTGMVAEVKMQIGVEVKGDIAAAHSPVAKSVPQVAHSVVRQITSQAADQQGNSIELTLKPEELGTVRLIISAGERPAVAVYADNPATLDLLRRHADLLARELRDTGIAGADLSFAEDSGAGRRQAAADRGSYEGFAGGRVASREEEAVPTVRPRPVLGSLIDIRI